MVVLLTGASDVIVLGSMADHRFGIDAMWFTYLNWFEFQKILEGFKMAGLEMNNGTDLYDDQYSLNIIMATQRWIPSLHGSLHVHRWLLFKLFYGRFG